MVHVFNRVIEDLKKSGLINEEDLGLITDLVSTLQMPYVSLKEDLEGHPQRQLTASYYSNFFKYQKDRAKDGAERHWYNMKTFMSSKSDKRVTDSSVTAACMQDPTYTALKDRESLSSYFHDQLTELRAAFSSRARMLEQVSNNARVQFKDDQEDDQL